MPPITEEKAGYCFMFLKRRSGMKILAIHACMMQVVIPVLFLTLWHFNLNQKGSIEF